MWGIRIYVKQQKKCYFQLQRSQGFTRSIIVTQIKDKCHADV